MSLVSSILTSLFIARSFPEIHLGFIAFKVLYPLYCCNVSNRFNASNCKFDSFLLQIFVLLHIQTTMECYGTSQPLPKLFGIRKKPTHNLNILKRPDIKKNSDDFTELYCRGNSNNTCAIFLTFFIFYYHKVSNEYNKC